MIPRDDSLARLNAGTLRRTLVADIAMRDDSLVDAFVVEREIWCAWAAILAALGCPPHEALALVLGQTEYACSRIVERFAETYPNGKTSREEPRVD